jgi:hypothetical protein
MDSSDARGYVVLGKLLVQQKRYDEARKLYADGTTATGEARVSVLVQARKKCWLCGLQLRQW